ncbi:MAG: TfoX/Sxy family protein [Gammaproteobacteria bacterium]|nr:TfoX/Sxy family protein [Gammaproteobacteria bacterium]
MSTQQKIVDFILEQISDAGSVSTKKMFGEYGLYCNGRMVALICDDELFIKITSAGKAFVGDCPLKAPYKGAKPCFFISGERWDEHEWLSHLIKISAAELPVPKKKIRKQKSTK